MSINEHLQGNLGFALYLQQINKDKLHILYDSQTSKVISMSKKVHKYFFQTAEDFHNINLLSYFPVVEKTLNKLFQKYKYNSSNNKLSLLSQNTFQNSEYGEQEKTKVCKLENQIESDKCNQTNQAEQIQNENLSNQKESQKIEQVIQNTNQLDKQKKAKQVYQKFQQIIQQNQNYCDSQEKLTNKIDKKAEEILGIQYLLVCKNKEKSDKNLKKEQNSSSQNENDEQTYLIQKYNFYILDFSINSVKRSYLTHLKYIEISNYKQINPILEASLILDICLNTNSNSYQSNINSLQKNQLEILIQELQLLKAYNAQELFKSIKFNQVQNISRKNLFKNLSSDNIKNELYQLNSIFQLQQKQQSIESQGQFQNSSNNSDKNQIQSQQQLEQELDLLNQSKQKSLQKQEVSNQTFQFITKQSSYDQQETNRVQKYQLSKGIISQNENSYGQDKFIQIIKENSCDNSQMRKDPIFQGIQNKIENQISSKQDSCINLSKTSRFPIIFNDINLTTYQNSNRQIVSYTGSVNTNGQSPCISTTQKSFLNNIKKGTLQNLIESQKSSQEVEKPQDFSSLYNQNQIQSRKNKQNENNQDFIDSSSNHSKSSSTTSNVRYFKNIIQSKKRLFTIQFVNLFGVLSLIVIIIVILQQYIQDSQNLNDFQGDMNVVGWPTDYMNTLSLIVKNFNLQKLLAYNDLIIKDGDLVKQQIHMQCQTEIVFAVNQIKNLTNQMELTSNQRYTFNKILNHPNVFRFGSNFDTHIPLNQQPADTYYQLVDIEMGLFYSLELLIIYLFRFAYGLGLGSGQFITLSNKQNIDEKLEIISNDSLNQMINSVNSIQDNLTKVLIVLIIVVFCCIFLTIPLYWVIQVKKQQILQLFGTFHQSIIQQEIQQIFTIVVNKYKSKNENFIILINQMKASFYDLKHEKKQIVSQTSKLNKFSFKITFLAAILFCLTLPYPIVDQYLCRNYITESKAVLKMLKQLYEMEQLIIENTGIHYFCIFLRISQATFPYKYDQHRQEVEQNLVTSKILRQDLQSSLDNLKATSLQLFFIFILNQLKFFQDIKRVNMKIFSLSYLNKISVKQ
ncbi:transmembrane protein, putative (macronuclear) [Tetrahymena thermophila SB210]|uniref:Transmembrane protein, putative n=1 Tax=Tetrahymena thermophila (strain SB210) TaxID=312017 RepID=I7M3V0_TETTS|nr:transmembrane protein, putative [Tetrahymena thermophila SB210]EAS04342.2 transmembrane protein, putative [Tetrahymena thermophila SB210]|eukprot:XP_001024587.2 transmembrane protein, putative [Tetrahymena thermophila SB210]